MNLQPDERILLELRAAPGSQWPLYIVTLGAWEYARRKRRWYLTNQRVVFVSGSNQRWTVQLDEIVVAEAHPFNAVMAKRWAEVQLTVRAEGGKSKRRKIQDPKRAEVETFAETLQTLLQEDGSAR